jgi:hypothetical protein
MTNGGAPPKPFTTKIFPQGIYDPSLKIFEVHDQF